MEWHQEKLLALCRICGAKIKDHKRKVYALKLSVEMNKVWQVSVLVDLPSVHPSFICVECWLNCGKCEYLEGNIKTATPAKTWYLQSDKCTVCVSNLEPKRGKPSKVKKAKVDEGEHDMLQEQESGTDSASSSSFSDQQMINVVKQKRAFMSSGKVTYKNLLWNSTRLTGKSFIWGCPPSEVKETSGLPIFFPNLQGSWYLAGF